MKKTRAYLIISLFLLAESLSAFYVFNYTVRTRKPILTYESGEEITCFSISNSGNSFVIGSPNGSVSYFSKGKLAPSWVYHGASEVLSVALSPEGDYAVSLDANDTINLFSGSPYVVQNETRPRWTYRIEDGAVSGVYSLGGIPPLIFILATVEGRIKLLSNRGLVWEYKTGAPRVVAEMSSDGRWVASADSEGGVCLFSVNSAEPLWRAPTGLTDVSLSLSQNGHMAVAGAHGDGGGRIYVLLLESGEIAWEWLADEPIGSVSISSDGSSVVAYQGDGEAYVLSKDGDGIRKRSIEIPGGVDSVRSPPFGPYVLALSLEGCAYFFYIPRSTPLWKYDAGGKTPKVEATSTGDKVFIATGREVAVVSNEFRTGFIPGSRGLWGVVFFVGVLGVAAIAYALKGAPGWLEFDRRGWFSLLLGLVSGASAALIVHWDFRTAVIAGVSCAIGTLLGQKREGFTILVMGFFAALGSSVVLGYLSGLLYWFSGLESDIITLTFTNTIGGGRIGVLYGVVGGFAGLITPRLPFLRRGPHL